MTTKQRLIENEKVLRRLNTSAKRAIKQYFAPDEDVADKPLEFNCECSNLDCGEAVSMTISEYEKLHRRKDRFVIISGHETSTVEKVVHKLDEYVVVEKYALEA